jgi:DNA polymerase
MSEEGQVPLTENTRRYYLDAMGIQCWEPLPGVVSGCVADAISSASESTVNESTVNKAAADKSKLREGVADFQLLGSTIQQCKNCQLHTTRKQAVLGRGNLSAALMFVLLSPDESADESGVLCAGEPFDLFSKMLGAINISIDDVYITSLLKCHVPDLHTVSASEIHHCNAYLQQQISLVQPSLIVALGSTAVRCALQKDVDLDKLRDEVNTVDVSNSFRFEGVPLFVSYSPHELLRKVENKRKAWADLKMIQQAIQKTSQR